MKALLLAAGLGTRLRPITNTTPKCLVKICDKPLLEIWLETLTSAGINEFLINTHYLNKKVEEFILNSKYKDRVKLIYEKELLGTGGTILENKDFFNDEPFIVLHADNLSIADYKDFISSYYLKEANIKCIMLTFIAEKPKECGIIKVDENNIVQEFHEKVENPPSNLANGAVYIFDNEIFPLLESLNSKHIDLSTQILPKLIGQIYAYRDCIYHIDIGTIDNYKKANKWYKNYLKNSTYFYLGNYFSKRFQLFKNRKMEILQKLKKQRAHLYKKNRVLAIYDTIDLPLSQDITTFILLAEANRRKYKLDKIDLIFMCQNEDPSPDRHPYITKDNRSQFIYNLAIEQSRLFNTIGSIFIFDNRQEFENFYIRNKKEYFIYPNNYNIKLPMLTFDKYFPHSWINLAPYLHKDSSLLCLTPPSDQINLARKWIIKFAYPKIPITITLREWDSWANERNSKIEEWQKLINHFSNNKRYFFIIIRDYSKLYDKKDSLIGDNLLYCNEATLSNSFRAAIYQESTLNLCVSNGSGIYMYANQFTRYIFFSICSKGRGASREALRDALGLYYGESYQGTNKYQKIVWERDTFEVLKNETKKMLNIIEKDLGLEPLFYTKNEEKIKKLRELKPIDSSIYKELKDTQRIPIKYYIYMYHIFNIKYKVSSIKNYTLKLLMKFKPKYLYAYIFFNHKSKILKNTKNIYIYGTGEYAKVWTKWAENNNKVVSGYIISNITKEKEFLGKPIIYVENFYNDSSSIIILATISGFSGFGMRDTIKNIHKKYIFFSPNNETFTQSKLNNEKIIQDSLEFIYVYKQFKVSNYLNKILH